MHCVCLSGHTNIILYFQLHPSTGLYIPQFFLHPTYICGLFSFYSRNLSLFSAFVYAPNIYGRCKRIFKDLQFIVTFISGTKWL